MRETRFPGSDGRYDNRAYQAAYRNQHPERRALWRLQAGLNECMKYPAIIDQARAAAAEFLQRTEAGTGSNQEVNA